MKNLIEKISKEVNEFQINNADDLERFRLEFLGKKGSVTLIFEDFKNLSKDDKKEYGQVINLLKKTAQQKYDANKNLSSGVKKQVANLDLSMPSLNTHNGSQHPLSIVKDRIIEIFSHIGFTVEEGPEIEDDWHVFTALNFPKEHPARDMQDTFFIDGNPDTVLRTHTSSVQVRVMEKGNLPIRAIFPGRVYRNEAISMRAHCFFHQVEGLYIDKNVSFADLKQTLLYFAKEMFGNDTKIRLRPSYFPFTEPSAEMDISCNLCDSKGCGFCKYTGWVEILGCGMVHPEVLKNCGIDSDKYSGYALGMGVERITNLLFGVKDLRLFSENDVRFLKQFETVTL